MSRHRGLVCCFLLTGLIHASSCYDIEKEISQLKQLYGRNVKDRPLGGRQKPLIEGRSLLGPYCHEKLGCFPTDGDFSDRLVNFKPNSRETINTKFRLFTRSNPTKEQVLSADDPDTITNSLYDSSRPTLFVIHGFLESTQAIWFPEMNAELLKHGDYNVIDVDWGGLFASKTLYTQATANTRVVAAEIVYLLKTLKAKSALSYNDVHIIGHSLGAHIAGYVGANLTNQIGRISGMDPAEPYFKGYSMAIKLDASDAQFVDVMHSDGDSFTEILTLDGGMGTSEVSGHADFFPNGGEDQPNCRNGIVTNVKLEDDLYEGLKRFVACDHNRAVDYYIQSVNNCPFNSVSCTDYSTFLKGSCNFDCTTPGQCNSMGFGAQKPTTPHKYYLQTTGEGNFCSRNYSIAIQLTEDSFEADGTIDLVLHGANRKKASVSISKESVKLKPGKPTTFTVGVGDAIDSVVGLEVTWTRDLAWWRLVTKLCGQFFNFCVGSVKMHEIKVTEPTGQSTYFCGSGKEFKSGIMMHLFYSAKSCSQGN